MPSPGVWNDLKVLRITPEGAHLAKGLLLPVEEVPTGAEVGSQVRVFVYLNAQDRLAATTRLPAAQRGEVALLKVVAVNKSGAFLAWGMPKDLLLPWAEVKKGQKKAIEVGEDLLVILFKDQEGRIAASTRLEEFLSDEAEGLLEGDKVALVIGDRTPMGVKVVVNHRYWGMVHNSDLFGPLAKGDRREGYIKALRADRKLDVSLSAPGYARVDAIALAVLEVLHARGGHLAVTDKSTPEAIFALFGVSKKAFKLAIGKLYKARQIAIEEEGIRLL